MNIHHQFTMEILNVMIGFVTIRFNHSPFWVPLVEQINGIKNTLT